MRVPAATAGPQAERVPERADRSRPRGRDEQRVVAASRATRLESAQFEFGLQLQEAQQEHGNQSGPDLSLDGIGAGATKVLILHSCLSDLKKSSTCRRFL